MCVDFGGLFLCHRNDPLPPVCCHINTGSAPVAQALGLIYYIWPEPVALECYYAASIVELPFSGAY
jgi:hypothetical protein